jgi:hypothetical protein
MLVLRVVAVFHAIIGLGLTIATARGPDKSNELLFCLCLLFSQAGLLGVWGGSSPAQALWRIATLCLGATVLVAEVLFAAKVTLPTSILLTLLPIACLGGPLFANRRWQIQLCAPGGTKSHGPPQFSIYQMLVFTTVVAVIITVIRLLVSIASILPSRATPFVRLPIDDYLVAMFSFSLCSILVVWGCLWGMLGTQKHSARRSALGLVPLVVGMLPVLFRGGHEWWIFIFASFVMELMVGVTLLAARLAGYRLICIPAALTPRNTSS